MTEEPRVQAILERLPLREKRALDVGDQPEEAILHGEDIDEVMRRYGDWPFCLIILARRRR